MKRTALLDTVRTVSPALSSKDFVAVLSCVCFDGKNATAYDEQVALSTKCDWSVEGGVNGSIISGWLSSARGTDVESEMNGTELSLKSGRSKLKIATIAKKDFVFAFPTEAGEQMKFPTALLTAIGKCLVSMGRDPSRPWAHGITMHWSGGELLLHSTNNIAACCAHVEMSPPKSEKLQTILLTPKFCELIVSIGKSDHPKTLTLGKGYVLVDFASGVRLFGRTSKDANPSQYQSLFSTEVLKKAKAVAQDIPKGLHDALERALVIASGSREKITKLTAKEGKLILTTSSPHGDVRDSVRLPDHPEVVESVSPDHMLSGLKEAEQMGIIAGMAVVFMAKKYVQIVATVQE